MEESYSDNLGGAKIDLGVPYQATGQWEIDRRKQWGSYELASKFAKGDPNDPDDRGLYGTSFPGFTLSVFENNIVTHYIITPDRTLKEFNGDSSSSILVSSLPKASAELSGVSYQYIGPTTSTYILGYFYICTSTTSGYQWVQLFGSADETETDSLTNDDVQTIFDNTFK